VLGDVPRLDERRAIADLLADAGDELRLIE